MAITRDALEVLRDLVAAEDRHHPVAIEGQLIKVHPLARPFLSALDRCSREDYRRVVRSPGGMAEMLALAEQLARPDE